MKTNFPFAHPLDEWVVVGKELLERNPDATLWDLFCVMYKYKTGHNIPDMPDELDVVNGHMLGQSTSTIANALGTDTGMIVSILKSIDYTPFRVDLPCSVHTIAICVSISSVGEAASAFDMTEHMVERAVDEYINWLEKRTWNKTN